MNEGILSRDFPQPSLGYFTMGDDEGVQLITFSNNIGKLKYLDNGKSHALLW